MNIDMNIDIDIDIETDEDEENFIDPSKKKYEDEATDKKWNSIFSIAITLRTRSHYRCEILTERYQTKMKSWENIPNTRFNNMQKMYLINHYKKEMQEEDEIQENAREIIKKIVYERNK